MYDHFKIYLAQKAFDLGMALTNKQINKQTINHNSLPF